MYMMYVILDKTEQITFISATGCKDYKHRKYDVGQTWVTQHGQMTCTPVGAVYQIGASVLYCYMNSY